ncbi:hypothetical protein [Actinomadura sp. 7K507]|uniref:hypothetical protein n=1 Tax=Actinomadura sp. 7K507 TaxID=2530365 RepID=UPI001FB68BDC|nr:hypothetical protein [Actinomadura sp. 7K507]
MSVEDVRQIFYDRNVDGVPVAKNLAMSMDQRDFGTHLPPPRRRDGQGRARGHVPLSRLVETRKRQIGKTDPEVITLSALRVLVIAAILARNGIAQSSTTVHQEDMPENVATEHLEREVVKIVSEFAGRRVPALCRLVGDLGPAVPRA